ncbi:MAG: hypothetical protein RLZZ214_429 [Verrucomicrobiota bacterium]|jgi:hypothetical protein
MGTTKNTACLVLGIATALASCAPKATVVAEAPAVKKVEKAPEQPVVEEPVLPVQEDDGLRGPDMLVMPDEGSFRSTNPTAPKTGAAAGAVIARPPTDPPSRVKPKAAEGE